MEHAPCQKVMKIIKMSGTKCVSGINSRSNIFETLSLKGIPALVTAMQYYSYTFNTKHILFQIKISYYFYYNNNIIAIFSESSSLESSTFSLYSKLYSHCCQISHVYVCVHYCVPKSHLCNILIS